MKLLFFLQVAKIEEKIKNAPNSSYEIGVIIGSYLPFVILVALAYFLYYKSKKKNNTNFHS